MEKFKDNHGREIISKTKLEANRSFEMGHIEHTQLDVIHICPKTNLAMGRPWLTLLIDEYSRGILAKNVSFEVPSHKSLEKTIQECIKKHSKLPNTITVNGSVGVYGKGLEGVVKNYNFNLEFRPENNLRYKSIIERTLRFMENRQLDMNVPLNMVTKLKRMNDYGLDI